MIMIDNFEPIQIEKLIGQSVQVQRMGLNPKGLADYVWYAFDGHRVQVERKQVDELLSSLDNVEEQLQRELSNDVEETILLIEGICQPVLGLKLATQSWHKVKDKNIIVPGRTFNCSYTGYKAWQNQLDKAGVTIVETFDYIATAMTLVALFQNSQKPEHKTLKRYIKDKVYIKSRNPHVISLMGIKNGGIGEEKAKALIDRYGTLWYTLTRPAEELAETIVGDCETGKRLGLKAANKLLKAVGKGG